MTWAPPSLDSLVEELRDLDDLLLAPITTAPPDRLTRKEEIGIRAFVILSHAAIEDFVEQLFLARIEECCRIDDHDRVHAGAYLALLEVAGDVTGQIKRDERHAVAVLKKIPPLYKSKTVGANNGIRRKNIKKLALGAGLGWPQLEGSCGELLNHADTLGSRRGAFAHTSSSADTHVSGGVQEVLYPSNVRDLTGNVIGALPVLTAHLEQHMSVVDSPVRLRRTIEVRRWASSIRRRAEAASRGWVGAG